MLAAVLEDIRRMVLKDVPRPVAGRGEAIVRMKACGICLTDYCAYTGARTNWKPGQIVGHEMSGIVEEVGPGVENFRPGDEVIVSPAIFCGECEYCKSGLQHYCPKGGVIGGEGFDTVLPGGFAEFVKAPAQTLYLKPPNVSFPAAALTEPLGGSYKGLISYTRLTIGEDVVIIGAGAMGLLVTQIAHAAGAGTLILIDIEDYKLEYARKCGATHTINSTKDDPKKAVAAILPRGPDIVFEAAGALPAAELAFGLCRRGTRINMFGVIVAGTIPVSPAEIHFSETRMDASFSVTPRVMLKAISLMRKGLVDTTKIITHEIPLKEIQEALDIMGTVDRVKVVVLP
ncbi:alcohol dehydrogenase catalytic domain-containing protein [bacterium]|nr:alcohol dehydrogenase catalytic domain-containing protein [bacterium]